MKYIIILAVSFLFGCDEKFPTKKPFIIVSKSQPYRDRYSYRYVDQNGILSDWFNDAPDKYSIGDTIN